MAKGFGKFLVFTALATAVCSGVYYFLTNEDKDYDLASEEADKDGSEDSKDGLMESFFKSKAEAEHEREYVSLKPQPKAADIVSDESAPEKTDVEEPSKETVSEDQVSSASGNEAIKEVVTKVCEEIKEKQTEEADNVGLVKDDATASDFAFKEFEEAIDN